MSIRRSVVQVGLLLMLSLLPLLPAQAQSDSVCTVTGKFRRDLVAKYELLWTNGHMMQFRVSWTSRPEALITAVNYRAQRPTSDVDVILKDVHNRPGNSVLSGEIVAYDIQTDPLDRVRLGFEVADGLARRRILLRMDDAFRAACLAELEAQS